MASTGLDREHDHTHDSCHTRIARLEQLLNDVAKEADRQRERGDGLQLRLIAVTGGTGELQGTGCRVKGEDGIVSDADKILHAIGSTEETSFREFCGALGGDCPTEKGEWRELFADLRALEQEGLVEVGRTDGHIDGMILTEAGIARVRERR